MKFDRFTDYKKIDQLSGAGAQFNPAANKSWKKSTLKIMLFKTPKRPDEPEARTNFSMATVNREYEKNEPYILSLLSEINN